MIIKTVAFTALCGTLTLAALSAVAEIAVPSGPVVLAVEGEVETPSGGDAVEFDLDMLEALPQRTTKTKTPWYDGRMIFTGPLLASVLESVEGEGDILRVHALNDYSAEIPVNEIHEYPVILATRVNGERLSVRDKGPLFVIYPFSEAPELYNELTFNKSVWQVSRIEVE